MSEILFKSLKNHDIQGLCLPCDIIYVKIVRGHIAILFGVPASQRDFGTKENDKKTLKISWNVSLEILFTMSKHMIVPSLVIIT